MKQRRARRFLKLDYTTALVVGTALLFIFALFILTTSWVRKHIRTTQDHTLPLKVTNLTYCNSEKLDLTVPQSSESVPLVIYVHGGGWQYGSKVTDNPDFLEPLVSKGVAVARINYRLSGEAKFPAAVQDVLCSVRFMRAHHEQFSIDPDKIALVGYSSGGNLAALAGLGADEPLFKSSEYSGYGSEVKAVVTLAAHLNLEAANFTDLTKTYIASWLNNHEDRAKANPIRYIDKNDPKLLILHALDDKAVPYSQAVEFKNVAEENNLPVTLLPIKNGGHNFRDWLGRDSPNSKQRSQTIDNFLLSEFSN